MKTNLHDEPKKLNQIKQNYLVYEKDQQIEFKRQLFIRVKNPLKF